MISKTTIFLSFLILSISAYGSPQLQSKLSQTSDESFDNFGSTVSISGDYILAGAPGQENNKGKACIYKRVGKNWNFHICLAAITEEGANITQFGRSVSLSQDYAVVGASQQSTGKIGVAYIFERESGTWQQTKELKDPDSEVNGNFGSAVSVSDNIIAIGAHSQAASKAGKVHIYKRSDANWIPNTTITSDSLTRSRRFGSSVMLSGDYMIIGDYENGPQHEGSAYVYKHNDDIWTRQDTLKGGTITRNGDYGIAVAISDSYAIVGAMSENHPTLKNKKKIGAAYVYRREGEHWHHQAKLTPSNPSSNDNFGSAVSISGNYLMVGTEKYNTSQGATHLYKNTQGIWEESFIFEASDGEKQDQFGHATSISEDYLAIGANNKSMGNNSLGEVYVYFLNRDTTKTASEIELSNTLASLDNSSNSTDTDGDGLTDNDEITLLGTDISSTDSDNDGLSDKEEVTIYQSDPLIADTDNDGISDLDEIVLYNSDPTLVDSDGDGFTDFEEIMITNTEPSLIDSDNDGFTDQQEITQINTNPSLADTDGDGLSDNEELNIFNTDPYQIDSDQDGFSDGNEVNYYETEPLEASSAPETPTISTAETPSAGEVGTMAFEDQWPLKGDYDFNDAVITYNAKETKQDGLVKEIVLKLLPVARGAVHKNSLRLLINTPFSNIASSQIKSQGQTTPLTAYPDGNKTLFIIIEDITNALPPPKGFKMSNTLSGSPKVNGKLHTVTISFNSPLLPSDLGAPPYNSFISRTLDNGETLEVHFPGRFPSSRASKRKFGQFDDDSDASLDRYYQTKDNLPWAMLIPTVWHHTKERIDLSNGYPDILNWAATKGKKNKGWYKSKRRGKFVFEDVADID